jgi:hypothetical protein
MLIESSESSDSDDAESNDADDLLSDYELLSENSSTNSSSNDASAAAHLLNKACMSIKDYNRKLGLINELVNLHKAKSMCKDCFFFRDNSINNPPIANANSANSTMFHLDELDTEMTCGPIRTSKLNNSIDLSECSFEGDRVSVENSNLKLDRDVSKWCLTRQIENLSTVCKYELPDGTVIKSGKSLRIEAPFTTSQLDFLLAIRKMKETESQSGGSNRFCIKIRTKLIAPDGTVKALHTQEIPQFYQEIFRYANLINIF